MALFAGDASAQTLTLDFGSHTGGVAGNATSLGLDFQGPSAFESGPFAGSWTVGARVNSRSDAWVGVGFAVQANLGSAFFVEGSLMPGYYREGDTDLGSSLAFRSLVGVGYRVNDRSSVMISYDHMGNFGLGNTDPGTEVVQLRYRIGL